MNIGIRSCSGAMAVFAARVMMVNESIVSLGGASSKSVSKLSRDGGRRDFLGGRIADFGKFQTDARYEAMSGLGLAVPLALIGWLPNYIACFGSVEKSCWPLTGPAVRNRR
jgi:hypothetical protein